MTVTTLSPLVDRLRKREFAGKYFVSRREARSVPATYSSEIRDRLFQVMGDQTGFSYYQALAS